MSRRALLVFALCLIPHGRAAVPTPESYFGHGMGADRTVLDWSKVVGYFWALEKNSDRIRVEELGKTTEGRPFLVAVLAAPETLRRLDHYRQIQARLADPRRTTAVEAESLIAAGKAVVLVTCSIHSTEIASTHTAVEFAYKLLAEDSPRRRAILANTIFLLVPSLNPDGVDIVTRWYRRTLGTPYEGASPPELYHKYVGHDNNRDWYMFTQAETRLAVSKIHNVWHPQIVYDVHQMGPYAARMFVPPWLDPIEPNIDPVIAQQANAIGAAMAAGLTAAGKRGVVIHAVYDYWTPARHYQSYHGGVRILSESASARIATPIEVRFDQLETHALGYNAQQRSWNHLEPWPGGVWRLRDIVDYQLIAMESCLYYAALHREELLRNFYGIGVRAVGRRDPPYAFVLPRFQRDPHSLTRLLQVLEFGQVEIERARGPFRAGNRPYETGDYVVRLAQPYGSFAKTLLERQRYPDLREYPGGPPRRPYDVTAHTLPLLMGVRADPIDAPFQADLERVARVAFEPGYVPAAGTVTLPAAWGNTWIAVNRLLRAGADVRRDARDGTFYVANAGPARTLLPELASALGLPLTGAPGSAGRPVRSARIGLYKSWVPNMDEGWTRWILEQFEFPYLSLTNRDIQAGRLAERLDVIILPDASPATMANGAAGMPPEFSGGLGDAGAAALKEFVLSGGTILAFNRASLYAASRLGLPVRDVLSGVPNREFYAPGSLFTGLVDTGRPLAAGLDRETAVWFESGPAFEIQGPGPVAVVRYPAGNPLASGWLLGAQFLENRAAVVDAPAGKGHVVLFGIRPQYRAQSHATFKLVFNALFAYL